MLDDTFVLELTLMVAQSRGLALTPATLGAVQGVATRIGVAGGTRGRFVRVMARDLAAFGLSDSDQLWVHCIVEFLDKVASG